MPRPPPPPPEAVSPEKEDYYVDILIYVTGCVLFILAVVIVVLCRMRMTTQKTLPTPPVQKLSKFPLKRQVTESRYKIRTPLFAPPSFSSLSRCLLSLVKSGEEEETAPLIPEVLST